MKKRYYVVCLALLVAALAIMPSAAQSAMWVGAELGGNFPGTTTLQVNGVDVNNVGLMRSVIGGATIGYDFVNSGFGAYAWPDWMKYFSFAMDITYNRLGVDSRNTIGVQTNVDGYCVAWTFLLMAHYGLFPDSVVPTGRVHPYIGVGPAIVWSGLDMDAAGIGSSTSTNVALVVEPGIRWVALPNVSIDTAFRWRYCTPSYDFHGTDVKVEPLNQFSFLVRANYHF